MIGRVVCVSAAVICLCSLVHASHPRRLPSLWGKNYKDILLKKYPATFAYKSYGRATKISTFWAQEAIGTPEAHNLLHDMAEEGFNFYATKIAIFNERTALNDGFRKVRISQALQEHMQNLKQESKQYLKENTSEWHLPEYQEALVSYHEQAYGTGKKANHHATGVANLITGEAPIGISLHGYIIGEVEIAYHQESHGEKLQVDIYIDPSSAGRDGLDIVNYSSTFANYDVYKAISDANKKHGNGMLHVLASGNFFPYPILGKKPNGREGRDKKLDFITVGSCSPTGCVSSFSQSHKDLTIHAPSDDLIVSITQPDQRKANFGGTSGAAPLVSGAIADFMSILPSLEFGVEEARHLLRSTATRTAIEENEGGGVLNYYKMIRVAKRIHDDAGSDHDLIKDRIYEEETYDFKEEAAEKKELAKQENDTLNKLKYLRESFFLNSEDRETRRLLSDIYERHGHVASATFYNDPGLSKEDKWVQMTQDYRRTLLEISKVKVFTKGENSNFTKRYRDLFNKVLDPKYPNSSALITKMLTRVVDIYPQYSIDLLLDKVGANIYEIATQNPHAYRVFLKAKYNELP